MGMPAASPEGKDGLGRLRKPCQERAHIPGGEFPGKQPGWSVGDSEMRKDGNPHLFGVIRSDATVRLADEAAGFILKNPVTRGAVLDEDHTQMMCKIVRMFRGAMLCKILRRSDSNDRCFGNLFGDQA
jgi:hypothetical protein